MPADDADDVEDVGSVERAGRVVIIGTANSGKSTLVNELVGTKVSITSPRPQTTRQKVLGIALISPRPGTPPTTQAVFVDTAGVMNMGTNQAEECHGSYRKKARKRFQKTDLHKAMNTTAWKAISHSDAVWWVLDAWRLHCYGDHMPQLAMLDGIVISESVPDAWWTHVELREELSLLRKFRKTKRQLYVILNKMDLLHDAGVDVDQFLLDMKTQLDRDLGSNYEGPLCSKMWAISALNDPDSLGPLRTWLCDNLPKRPPLYPLDTVSDVPARVLASEITREKLFEVLRGGVAYSILVVTTVWREKEDGTLMLGQKIATKNRWEHEIVSKVMKKINHAAEDAISETLNFGRPVFLHFKVRNEPNWESNHGYYEDLQGLLDDPSGASLHFVGDDVDELMDSEREMSPEELERVNNPTPTFRSKTAWARDDDGQVRPDWSDR